MIDLDELERRARAATRGEWMVVEQNNPMPDGTPGGTERTIHTRWHHPQVQGPLCVVGMSLTVYQRRQMVHIEEADAAYIAAANPQAILELLAELREAREAMAVMYSVQKAMKWVPLETGTGGEIGTTLAGQEARGE